MAMQVKTRGKRSIWFFFTLSLGLWITAGIAWFYTLFWEAAVTFLTNPSVPISNRVVFGAIVLPVAPMLVVVFTFLLWSAYHFTPNKLPLREVLDGLFGLGVQRGKTSIQLDEG